MKQLLLLSSSRTYGSAPLEHAQEHIDDFLGERRHILFVPYAAVTISDEEYLARVSKQLVPRGYQLSMASREIDPETALDEADAVMVGGGNTFRLLSELQRTGMLGAIRERALAGMPYIGWSAGSNMACPTLRTTNDMPVIEPESFDALGLIPFQINPHYTDAHPPEHQGETRDDRLAEFLVMNPSVPVLGLREGSMLRVDGAKATLLGEPQARLFRQGEVVKDYASGSDLSALLV